MSIDDFVQQYDGKGIDFDGAYGFQCMDLAHRYAVDVVGIDIPAAPAAKDEWNNNISGYDKIANTPSGLPQKGDIVVWGTGVGPYGHIAVFLDGNLTTFNSFDQNWPVNSLCHKQQHNYNGVLGWFHPKTTVTDSLSVPKADFENLVRKSTQYDTICKYLGFDTTSTDGAKLVSAFEDVKSQLQSCRADLDTKTALLAKSPPVSSDSSVSGSGTGNSVSTGTVVLGGDNSTSSSATNTDTASIPPQVQTVATGTNTFTSFFHIVWGWFK